LIVSAERRLVTAVGSGSPVRAATRTCLGAGATSSVVVVLVVVESAPALPATPTTANERAIPRMGRRRTKKN
jgi:hypothetical protein